MCGACAMEGVEAKAPKSWRALLKQAVSLYVFSRAAFVIVGLFVSAFAFGNLAPGGALPLNQPWHIFLFRLVYTSDSAFYHSIAMHGYRRVHFNTHKQYNWAFFPLFPYLSRWTRDLVHLRVVDAGVLWSQMSMVVFLTLLGRLVDQKRGPRLALTAMTLAAFSPLTPYFVAYRAAALFLALSTAVFYFLENSQWNLALLAGAAASLTRPVGILLAVPYLVALGNAFTPLSTLFRKGIGASAFAFGFAVVGFIDWRFTSNPLAFLAIQTAWNRKTRFPFASSLRWLSHLGLTAQGGWSFPSLAITASIVALLAAIYLYRQGREFWPGAAYIFVTVILANASNSFEGIPRFIAELPPIYVAMALWVENHPRRQLSQPIVVGILFTAYIALWALGIHAVQN